MTIVAAVQGLWRYPVKSMGAEALGQAVLGPMGVPGDRTWALRDEAAGEIRGAKKFPLLLLCRVRTLEEPAPGQSAPVEVTLPDGRCFVSSDPALAAALSALLGREVTMWPLRPADERDHYRRGVPDNPDLLGELRDLFGRLEDEPLPDLSVFSPELMEFTSPLGTYFDAAPIHLVTTASLDAMARVAPGSSFAAGRFRANLVLATAAAAGSGLVENAWVGRRLRVGQAVLRVLMPTPRCSMVTQPNGAEGKDPGVLRAIVRDAAQNLGVYAEVVEPGVVREGDQAVLLDT